MLTHKVQHRHNLDRRSLVGLKIHALTWSNIVQGNHLAARLRIQIELSGHVDSWMCGGRGRRRGRVQTILVSTRKRCLEATWKLRV